MQIDPILMNGCSDVVQVLKLGALQQRRKLFNVTVQLGSETNLVRPLFTSRRHCK